ncbi:MFS transporter [Psychromicrobium xiongbiense]|uniref:MFS transporter n=1 Tax=Psychromicrobium xiongbiense TaxID=3051184 RepID=UPI002554AD54|nr:MFS transporter [Psychromicrobium sp. YIM S02556]
MQSPARSGASARWMMLGIVVFAQAVSSLTVNGTAFLLPELDRQWGLGLMSAGFLVSMPLAGTLCTLVLWGAVIDRIGERASLTLGLAAAALALGAAALSGGPVAAGLWLFLSGVAVACTNAAGGRIVVGWFPVQQRGLAMGIRQMAQPLGVGWGALMLPTAGAATLSTAWWVVALLSLLAAGLCWFWLRNPERRARRTDPATENPYRGSSFLLRIHLISALLVVPQFTLWTFSLIWLLTGLHLDAPAAGAVIVVAQLTGALGRIGAGVWSDRWGSRVAPLRWVSVSTTVALLLLSLSALLAQSGPAPAPLTVPLAVVALVLASALTVADNGLAFTVVAEAAGPYWSARALGIQNTGQYLVSAIVPPLVGGLLGVLSFPATFALIGIIPAVATPLVPSRDEERRAVVAAH